MLKCYLPHNSSITAYPLGYHTIARPDSISKCDMPGCFNNSESFEWTIFHGCAHSYHYLCLQGYDHCPICQLHLKTIVNKLASSANDAFANGSAQPVDSKTCDDLTNDLPTLPNSNDKNCDAEVNNLYKKIKDLRPKTPSVYNTSMNTAKAKSLFKNEVSKHPHCKKCSHQRKGHTYQKGKKIGTTCLYCPKMICSMEGRNSPCKCEWHLKEKSLQSNLDLPHRGFYNTLHFDCVQELLLPSKASQSGFARKPINSCTAIATLVCLHSNRGLLANMNVNDHTTLTEKYCELMKIGNLK